MRCQSIAHGTRRGTPAPASPRRARSRGDRDAGVALLVVLIVLLAVTGVSASFIWFMNRHQARAGARLRAGAALAAAEAGVHRAVAILEAAAPDSRRGWRPTAFTETYRVGPFEGRFTLSLTDGDGGVVLVTSTGAVAGATRRLRARVHLTSPALLAGLYGAGLVRLEERPGAMLILPYGAGLGDLPWVHVAAGQGLWFATKDVSINDATVPLDAGPGPLDLPAGVSGSAAPPQPGPIRLLTAHGARVTLGPGQENSILDLQQLRAMGVTVLGDVRRTEAFPQAPEVDRPYYQARAAANLANAGLNETAGRHLGDRDLEQKRDSLYSRREFEQVQTYLQAALSAPMLQGVIYVRGGVSLREGQRLQVAGGSLIAEDTVSLSEGASLEITHSATTRALPGLLVLDRGGLAVTREARLRVHGLVLVNRIIDISHGARADIVGAVLGLDHKLSFRNLAARVVIRYDPAVRGTPGLRVPDDSSVLAWIASWEELP